MVKPLYYHSSVLKSTSFSPNSFPQSFLSIPDLCCSSEIRTFRCYKGIAYKLRPSPFGIYLQSLESAFLLPELNINQKKYKKNTSGPDESRPLLGPLSLHNLAVGGRRRRKAISTVVG
jgi:hypothetical protein